MHITWHKIVVAIFYLARKVNIPSHFKFRICGIFVDHFINQVNLSLLNQFPDTLFRKSALVHVFEKVRSWKNPLNRNFIFLENSCFKISEWGQLSKKF